MAWTMRPRGAALRALPLVLCGLAYLACALLPCTPALASPGDRSPAVTAPPAPSPLAARTRVALAEVSDGSHYRHLDLAAASRLALATAMLDAQRIEIVPDDEIALAIDRLGLKSPLEDEQLLEVGKAVRAQVVVAARCVEARYDDYNKQATVGLRARILDTRAGLAVRTCQVRGASARNGHPLSERQLVEDAVDEAGRLAIEELKRNLTVVGTIGLALDAERVRVTLTSADGVRIGTKLQAWDRDRQIADLVVTEVSEVGSACRLTRGSVRDLAPGTTVYVTEFAPAAEDETASGPAEGGRKKSHSKLGTAIGVILGVGLLYLAYQELTKDRNSSSGYVASFRGLQNRAQIQSGQTVQLEVGVTNSRGQAVPDDTEVEFLLLPAAGAARVRQAQAYLGSIESPKRTAAGIVETTFIAGTAGQSVQIVLQIGKFRSSIIVDIVSGVPASVTLASADPTIAANGVSSASIVATVTDGSGNPVVDGTVVTFETTAGEIVMGQVTTVGGEATTLLRSTQSAGPATVTASVGGVSSQPLVITFEPGAPSQVILSASKTNLRSGDGTATVTVRVLDLYGNPVPDTTRVTFGVQPATAGRFSVTQTATAGGQAATVFSAGATPQLATITCEAVDPAQNPPLPVQGSLEVNIAGTAPDEIQLLVSPATAPADGATTIQVRALVLQSGSPVADGTPVTFALTDNIGGSAAIRSRDLVTKDGQALALVASTSAGVATIRASSTSGSATPQDASFEFTGLPANAIILAVAASPIRIGQDNAGSPAQPGMAATTVTATVTDGRGQPVTDGTAVLFTTDRGTVSPRQAETTGGRVTVTFTSLTTGTAQITAESGTASAETTIQVLAGPAAALTVAATPLAVRADGNSFATVTCTVVDASGNRVDDGTRVTFEAWDRAVNGSGDSVERVFVTPEGRTLGGVVTGVLVSKLADANGQPIEQAAPPGSVFVTATVPSIQDPPIPGPATPVSNGAADVQFVSRFVSFIDLGVRPINVRGLDVVGNEAVATALVYDDQHNPVPDGTAVYFTASHGMIRGNNGSVGGVAQSYTSNGVASATILTPGGLATGILNEPTFDGFVRLTVSVGGPPGYIPADGLQMDFPGAVLFSGAAFTVDPSDPTAGPTTVLENGGKTSLYPTGDSITYTLTILDENENPVVDGTEIELATSKGLLDQAVVTTRGGVALATLRSTRTIDDDPIQLGPGTFTVSIPRGNGMANLVYNLPFTVIPPP